MVPYRRESNVITSRFPGRTPQKHIDLGVPPPCPTVSAPSSWHLGRFEERQTLPLSSNHRPYLVFQLLAVSKEFISNLLKTVVKLRFSKRQYTKFNQPPRTRRHSVCNSKNTNAWDNTKIRKRLHTFPPLPSSVFQCNVNADGTKSCHQMPTAPNRKWMHWGRDGGREKAGQRKTGRWRFCRQPKQGHKAFCYSYNSFANVTHTSLMLDTTV